MERIRLASTLALISLFILTYTSPSYAQTAETFSNLGIYGGMVEDITFVPGTPGAVFAATYEGDGVYRSADGGATWTGVAVDNDAGPADTFKNNDVFQIAVAPSDPQVIYVVHNDWVDISTDGGATWINVLNTTMQRNCLDCGGEGDDFRLCQTVAVDPIDPAVAYVGTVGPHDTYEGGAIYKTTDMGLSWQKMNQGADFDYAIKDLAIDPQNPTIVWAVTSSEGRGTTGGVAWGGSLYRSGDSGATWATIDTLAPVAPFGSVRVKPDDSNTVFTGSSFGVIKHVLGEGDTWERVYVLDSRLAYDLALDPQDPNVLYASWLWPTAWGGDGIGKVSRTTDGGTTWETFPHEYEFNTLAVDPVNSEVLLAGDFTRGMFRSDDHGQTWAPSNQGLSAGGATVYDVAVDPADTGHLLVGTATALLERSGPDSPWATILDAPIRSIRFHPTDAQIFYAGTSRTGLARTGDGGASWSYTVIPGPEGTANNDVTHIAIDPTQTDTLYVAVSGHTGYGAIYRSRDGGQTLTEVLAGVNLADESYPFNTVAIDPFDPNHLFAGGGSFYVPKILGDLWESTDGGDTWTRTGLHDDQETTTGVIVNALLMDPGTEGLIYAGTGYSAGTYHPLHVSNDGGATWAPLHEGFPIASSNAVKDLEFHRENPGILYAGTLRRGIFISPNRGAAWANLGTPEYNLRAIAVGSVYGATEGGLYQLTGTGCIFGDVADSATSGRITGADVFTDAGIHSTTVGGEYILISPAGIHDVTANAAGYPTTTHADVTLPGGDAVRRDFSLQTGTYPIGVSDSAAPVHDRVLSFGNLDQGGSAAISVTLTNLGEATVSVSEIGEAGALEAPFQLVEDGCTGAILDAAGTCTFNVLFSPDADSPATTSFAIAYGDAEDAVTVRVYGNTNTLAAASLVWPEPDAEIGGDTVEFRWTEANGVGPGLEHYLYCSADPGFAAEPPYEVAAAESLGLYLAGTGSFALLIGVALPGAPRRRRPLLLIAALLCAAAALASCAGSSSDDDPQIRRTVSGLDAATTYYWKVVLDDGAGGHVESETRSFTTK